MRSLPLARLTGMLWPTSGNAAWVRAGAGAVAWWT